MKQTTSDPRNSPIDFSKLYDEHPEYDARRAENSPEIAQIQIEITYFKLPYLLNQLRGERIQSALEIGCATGELIAAMPTLNGGQRMGIDISSRNIEVARKRFPSVAFQAGDFRSLHLPRFDVVILSDILEHVVDDAQFLSDASKLASKVLVNLPLECNWLNRNRSYGPEDSSGHLRAYNLEQGLELFERAGLHIVQWQQIWIHDTRAESLRRALRKKEDGRAFAGNFLSATMRHAVADAAKIFPPFGRRLFASNLFALASRK